MPTAKEPLENARDGRDAARKAWRFGGIATAILIAAMAAFAGLMRFEVFGAGFHVNFALVLGVLGTILLGVGLMALSFYSDRSGTDDGVIGMDEEGWDGKDRQNSANS